MTMEKKKEGRELTVLFTAVGVITVGCGILIAALVIPPPGVIDNSVLVAFGEISTFAGALFGVRLRRSAQKTETNGTE